MLVSLVGLFLCKHTQVSLTVYTVHLFHTALALPTLLHTEENTEEISCDGISLPLTFLLTGGIGAVPLVGFSQLAVAYKRKRFLDF